MKVHIFFLKSTCFTCQKTPQKYMTYYTEVHDLLRKSTYLLPKKYIVLNKNPLFLSTFRLLNKINKKKNDVYVNLTQLIHVDAITKRLKYLEGKYSKLNKLCTTH